MILLFGCAVVVKKTNCIIIKPKILLCILCSVEKCTFSKILRFLKDKKQGRVMYKRPGLKRDQIEADKIICTILT